jgi:hypothetical protein
MVTQISVFLKNQAGQLALVTDLLGQAGINIRALTVSESADYGILRMIVSDPENAVNVLKENFLVDSTEVIACELQDKPGSLHEIAVELGGANINIEYLYAFVGRANEAILILRVENNMQSQAIEILQAKEIRIYSPEELYAL